MNSERLHQSLRPLSSNTQDYIEELLKTQKSKSQGELYNQMQKFIDKYGEFYNQAGKNVIDKVPQKWIAPVDLNKYKITSRYGWRVHPVYKIRKLHDGIDIGTPINTPVKAVADGKVSVSGWIKGYGNYIQIEHSGNLSSFYAHLSYKAVKVGQIVRQGQIIGKSGNTGIGTGSHLHFGAKKNGKTANPINYVKN